MVSNVPGRSRLLLQSLGVKWNLLDKDLALVPIARPMLED